MGNTPSMRRASSESPLKVKNQKLRKSRFWHSRQRLNSRKDLTDLTDTTIMVHNPDLNISEWLRILDLQEYKGAFQLFENVVELLELSDDDLKSYGVVQRTHRFKMLSSLIGIRAKLRQSTIRVSTLPRASSKSKSSWPPESTTDSKQEGNVEKKNDEKIQKEKTHEIATSPIENHHYEPLKISPSVIRYSSIHRLLDSSTNMTTPSDIPSLAQPPPPVGGQVLAAPPRTTQSQLATSPGSNTQPIGNEYQEALALKRALEWELGLDVKDLRSHAWYHGPLPRQRAEEIVVRDGDFLVRDCASQPDNYVLSCRSRNLVLHFVINKILIQPQTVYERVQYQFEEEAFDAIPDLITFYVGSGKAVSAASGARIQFPCNRAYPLSFYGHKIVGNQLHTQMLTGMISVNPLNSPTICPNTPQFPESPVQQQKSPSAGSQVASPLSSPPRSKRLDAPLPRVPSKKQRSQSLTPIQAIVVSNIMQAECNELDSNGGNENHTGVGVRRFNNMERFNSVGSGGSLDMKFHAHMEQLSQKLAGNGMGNGGGSGFRTIARCTMNDAIVSEQVKFTTHSLPRSANAVNFSRGGFVRGAGGGSLARNFSIDSSPFSSSFDGRQISAVLEEGRPPSPPPKPNRVTLPRREKDGVILAEQQNALHRAAAAATAAGAGLYHTSGSDSGNGSGDSVPGDFSDFSMHRGGVIIKNPNYMSNSTSSATLKSLSDFNADAVEEQLFMLELPEFKPVSKFDFENFNTLLLPLTNNHPLDGDALNTFKIMLLETGPKLIAEHLTRIDVGLLIEPPSAPETESNDMDHHVDVENCDNNHNVLNCCGLEMLMLPQGKIFRQDLIERTQCIKLMVAVTILTCQTEYDRAQLLSRWIQIAVETKTALGNLFGFCAIMLGLCMPQVQKLENTWHILRQKYTDSAFTFEAKLRPTLISMNECSNPQAPNTTVPHVLLHALLKDRPVIDLLSVDSTTDKSSLYTACISSWEIKADDFGMTINYLHLNSVRGFLASLDLYRKNAKIMLEESNSRLDELLVDAFRTEFHVKFLWGSQGALASAEDRHVKLEKVLTLMADRFCNADTNAST